MKVKKNSGLIMLGGKIVAKNISIGKPQKSPNNKKIVADDLSNNLFRRAEDLIANDKLSQALNELLSWARNHNNGDAVKNLIIQSERLNKITNDTNLNQVSLEEERTIRARISSALLIMMDDLGLAS